MTTAIELSAEKVNVNLEEGTVIVTGITADDVVAQFEMIELLEAAIEHFDFGTVFDYMMERKNEDK